MLGTTNHVRLGRWAWVGGGDDVYTVQHKGLACCFEHSAHRFDPTREDVFAHEQVNETVMREFTVLPMAFGALFGLKRISVELIRGTYDALRDVLAKMEGGLSLD